MDLVVQKATELGVAAIVPVATARSVVKLDAATAARASSAHWRGIAIAACEQCGRAVVPRLAEPRTLEILACCARAPQARALLLSPDAQHLARGDAAQGASPIELLVGPEGGLDGGRAASGGSRQAIAPAGSGRACCAAKPRRSRRSRYCSLQRATSADDASKGTFTFSS